MEKLYFWNVVILAITACAIIWYTIETRRLVSLTRKEIKLNIRPAIVVTSVGTSMRLKNIGKSPALNITMKDIVRKSNPPKETYKFKFSRKSQLGVGEECGLAVSSYCNDKQIVASGDSDNIKKYFLDYNSLTEKQAFSLIIEYNDIEMGKWRSVSLVNNKGIHFFKLVDLG